jgi:hypothetical protein
MRLPLGDLLYSHPSLLKILTHLVYAIELVLPFLILWPSTKSTSRALAFLLILLLHTGIGLTLYVGLFYMISIGTAIGLVPSSVFDKAESRVHFLKSNNNAEQMHLKIKFKHCIVLCVILLCLLINFSSLSWFPYRAGKELRFAGNVLRLNQYWGMFSPGVLKKDGWMVYHGLDSLGRQWDLRLNKDHVDYSKPNRITSLYKNERWRKLAENMQNEDFTFLRHMYANNCLKRWNKIHPEKPIKTLYLYFMEQETLADYKKTQAKKTLYAISSAP